MNKKIKVISGIFISASGMAVAGVSSEWYFFVLGCVMIVVGNIFSIGTGGNENEFNSNFKGR